MFKNAKLSKDANKNYVCTVTKISNLVPIEWADRIQIAIVLWQEVITWMDVNIWDLVVYFPVEAKLSEAFLSKNNLYDDKTLNKDSSVKWYIHKSGRIKMLSLRWVRSFGMIMPLNKNTKLKEWDMFDTIDNNIFIEKFIPPSMLIPGTNKVRKDKKSMIVDQWFPQHIDTYPIYKNIDKIFQNWMKYGMSVSYKLHGTSARFGNCLVKNKIGWFGKFVGMFWVNVQKTSYKLVYWTRRVVKNDSYTLKNDWFYWTDVYGEVAQSLEWKIPKWYTVYGEIVWYQSNGKPIQKWYDYWCEVWEKEFYAYRVMFTNEDWVSYNLSTHSAAHLCELWNIKFVDVISFNVKPAKKEFMFDSLKKLLPATCYMCKGDMPPEWLVVRINRWDSFEAYKYKTPEFLEYETNQFDIEEKELELELEDLSKLKELDDTTTKSENTKGATMIKNNT